MAHDNSYVDRKFEVIGNRFKRPDGVDKVTGRARFGADTFAPGQLVGRILRSPHAHAKIKKINTKKAEALPGSSWGFETKDGTIKFMLFVS